MLLTPRTPLSHLLPLALLALGCEPTPRSTPPPDVPVAEDPTPPAGLTIQGNDLLQWDTTTPEFSRAIAGTGAVLAGVLASPRGKRRVELREAGRVHVLAAAGWNLPAAGVAAPTGERVVCWNVALGPERSGGRPPHPTGGVGLRCATVSERGTSPAVDAAEQGVTASWLQDLSARGGRIELRYLRDRTGWLVLHDDEGGTWARPLTVTSAGLSVGGSALVEPLGGQPGEP